MGLMLLPLGAMAKQTILVFGDSLSAAYGIPRESGWVTLLEHRLSKEKPQYSIVNASISGETTSGGLRRISPLLQEHQPAIVILELGANDGLRGLPVDQMQQNLAEIIRKCLTAKARVVLVGMRIPPNYGITYAKEFSGAYPTLARTFRTALVPFLLTGVAGNPSLVQQDGLHPLAEAQPELLNQVWPQLQPLLK